MIRVLVGGSPTHSLHMARDWDWVLSPLKMRIISKVYGKLGRGSHPVAGNEITAPIAELSRS